VSARNALWAAVAAFACAAAFAISVRADVTPADNSPAGFPRPLLASRLALPLGDRGIASGSLLAQRVIDREWGPSEDSTYKVVEIPGWKSEGVAMGLSAVLPGAGQLYAGEGSGWLYLVAESAGWMERWLQRRTATRKYDDMVRFAGDPGDSSSGFSFARYTKQTGAPTDQLQALWNGDRNAYYRALAGDPQYTAGFVGPVPSSSYAQFSGLLTSHDDALHTATVFESLLLVQHVIAAVDAIRAARLHDIPLRQQYQLELAENWRHGRPEMRAAIVRRF